MIDDYFMELAIAEAKKCPPSELYNVGCIIALKGRVISSGYSREDDPLIHAEESALKKLEWIAAGSDIYSTMEPCSQRTSRPESCTELIIQSRATRVIYGCREPSNFVPDCQGVELLAKSGIEVVQLFKYEKPALELNSHLNLITR